MPSMGDSVSEGTVVEFAKQAGALALCGSGLDANSLSSVSRLCGGAGNSQHAASHGMQSHSHGAANKVVAAGDPVNEDDVVVQVETDKVTIDVRYTDSTPGVIKEFLVKPDDTVTVGQEVAIIDKGADTGGEACAPTFVLCV